MIYLIAILCLGAAGLESSIIAQKSIYDIFDSYSLPYQVVVNVASPKQIIVID